MTWLAPTALYISQPRSARYDELAELACSRSEPIIDTESAEYHHRDTEQPGGGHQGRRRGTTAETAAAIAERRRQTLLFLAAPRLTLAVAHHVGIAKRTALWLLDQLHAEGLVSRSRGPGSGSPSVWRIA